MHFIEAWVDPFAEIGEEREDNNSATRAFFSGLSPDLAMCEADILVSNCVPSKDKAITVSVRVRNQGGVAAEGRLTLTFTDELGLQQTLLKKQILVPACEESLCGHYFEAMEWTVPFDVADIGTVLTAEVTNINPPDFSLTNNHTELRLPCNDIDYEFIRGDANSDGDMNLADAIYILQYLFASGPGFLCPDAADANDQLQVDISDAVYILQNLFAQGPAIPPPHPELGVDPTAEDPPLPPCFYPRPYCEDPEGSEGCQGPP
jgi:hypothetical protein